MDIDIFKSYYSCMENIIAGEQILRIESTDYPNGKMDYKRKTNKKYQDILVPPHLMPHRRVTTKEAFKMIGKDLNG
ncbi:MAG: hypothetical protein V3R57_06215 [Candidatus Bathyarchaeia archaeon]